MAIPAQTTLSVLDNFNRANAPLGAPNYVASGCVSGDINLKVLSNQCVAAGTSAPSSAYWTPAFSTGPFESYASVMSPGAGVVQIAFLRSQGNGYLCAVNMDTGLIVINKLVNNVPTSLTSKSVTYSAGMVVYCYIEDTGTGATRIYMGRIPNPGAGQTITADQNSTDASFGWIGSQPVYIGMRVSGATATTGIIDNFAAGALVTTVDATVVAPPATFNATSVAPSVRVDETLVAPPANFTAASTAPVANVSLVVVAPVAQFTTSAVAPVVSGTALVVAPPAFFSVGAVAPLLIRSPLVIAPAASWTASAIGPGLGRQIISPPAIFTVGAIAPATRVDVTLFPNAIGWTANQMGTVVVTSVLPNAAMFTASAVAPFPFLGVYIFPTVGVWTASSVAPKLTSTIFPAATLFSASSVAPLINRTIPTTPATASYSSVAPKLASTLPAVAATVSYNSVAPSFVTGSGMALSVPAAGFVAAATAPATSLLTSVPAAQFSASSAAPALIKIVSVPFAVATFSVPVSIPMSSPIVVAPVSRLTMSAGAVSLSFTLAVVPPQFAAGASAPILFNVIGVTFGIFTVSAPSPLLLRVTPSVAAVATFSSVAGKIQMVVPVPAGEWDANANIPNFALRVVVETEALYFFPLDHSLNIEKRIFAVACRWTASTVAPKPGIALSAPVSLWTANSTTAAMSRGTVALPIHAYFYQTFPTLTIYSPPSVYTYIPGDIDESTSWSQWQH